MSTAPRHNPVPSSPGDDGQVLGGRRWTLVLSVIVIVLVVVGGTAAVLINRSARESAASQPDTASPAAPQPTQSNRADWGLPYLDELGFRVEVPPNPNGIALDQDPGSRPDPSSADYQSAPPAGVIWQKVQNYPLPFSASDGPTAVDGALATGFARTPQGAALAGLQLVNRSQSTFEGAAAVMSTRAVASTPELQTELDRNLANAQRQIAAGNTAPPAKPLFRQEAYRLTYYSSDYAVIEYAGKNVSGNGWTTVPIELLWRGGDWSLKLAEAGKVGNPPTLAGWTQWPGK